MATKRLARTKKRNGSSTLIANPRRKTRKASTRRKASASSRKRKPAPRRRKRANPAARKRSTSLARRRSKAPARRTASRKARRRNPSVGAGVSNVKEMLKNLPILEIAAAGAGAIFISNLIVGIPAVKKKINEMKAGTAKDMVGGLIGPVATFGAALAVVHFGKKSAKAKKIGQFMAYAALFQATNAVIGAQIQKGVASLVMTEEEKKAAAAAASLKKPDADGFGGAWISDGTDPFVNAARYGGLGAGAYFDPNAADMGGAWLAEDTPNSFAQAPIKIAGFGGFN